jgi:hypothetical protein
MSYTVTIPKQGAEDATFTVNHSAAGSIKVVDGHLFLRDDKRVVAAYAPGAWLSVTEVEAPAS